MMPRQQSIDANTSNNMNVSAHNNMNFHGGRGGNNNNSSNSSHNNPGTGKHGDHSRRYSHHGPGNMGGNDAGASTPGGHVGGGGGGGGMMGDFGGLPNHHQLGRAMGLGPGLPFGPGGGMNPGMNPGLYPHLGHPGMSQQQFAQAQQQHLDFRGGGSSGEPGANASAAAQAEREEELLLNLLMARRQRQAMRGAAGHQMDPTGCGGAPHWTDEWMRLRQQQEQLGASGAGGEGHNQFEGGDGSRRPNARVSMVGANGMGQLNMNNFNMPGGQQFLQDPSTRLQHQLGNGMGLQMGSPQGAWGANAGMMGNPGAMHPHPNTPGRNDGGYPQRAADMNNMNTQLQLDVLQRADPMMRSNMMYDARMAEQGAMGMDQNPYQPYGMGRQHAQMHMHGGYPQKRGMDGAGMKLDKHGNPLPMRPEDQSDKKKAKRQHKKKPADMPRRPLSAYNLFFSEERERIIREIDGKNDDEGDKKEDGERKEGEEDSKPKALLRPLLPSEKKRRPHRKTHGKISFQELAQKVGQRWKNLSDERRKYYQDLAQEDMKRQKKAMEEYYQKRSALTANEANKEVNAS